MFLSKIYLDPRCKEVRRDLADPYELHSTLCRAFSEKDRACPEGEFLWRLEPENGVVKCLWPLILVQSRSRPNWSRITVKNWFAREPEPALDLRQRLNLNHLKDGQRFRFRLRANPCVTRNGKRLGLLKSAEQEAWLVRKGQQHGFLLPNLMPCDFTNTEKYRPYVRITQEQMLRGRKRDGREISIFSVLYDGILIVSDPEQFRKALQTGIGHGKAMGLGLLSVVPVKC